ncbi:hypothetical protein [Helicobacter canis]|uniref:hypothetical protein n=1 Tax=Helicobacter canis TaxID=29419 RepID=UPI001B33FEFE|nr:hypothetical protein [Helicobacter canis]
MWRLCIERAFSTFASALCMRGKGAREAGRHALASILRDFSPPRIHPRLWLRKLYTKARILALQSFYKRA